MNNGSVKSSREKFNSTGKSSRRSIFAKACAFLIAAIFAVGNLPELKVSAAGTYSGTVFLDYNGNSVFDSTATQLETGVGGVTVTLYDNSGAARGTATTSTATATLGQYSISSTGSGPYRVEFTNIPTYLKPGAFGTTAGTTVQFVADGTTANVNLALIDSGKFNNEANPETATTLFLNGQYNAPAINGLTSLMRTPYNATGHDFTGTTPTGSFQGVELAEIQETGAVYGMAWQSSRNRVYVGSYHKRYSGFGANGPDAVYVFDKQGNTIGTIDLDALTGTTNSAGADVHDFTATGGIIYDIGAGNASYDGIGKRSLGDIDMSADQKTLFVVNLFDRRIYAINVASGTPSGATLIKSWAAPDATSAGRHRPFALAWHQGKLWVGSVDQNASSAYVHSITPNLASSTPSETFTLEHTVALNYTRQSTAGGATEAGRAATWRAWSSDPATVVPIVNDTREIANPQPMLSDIEFDQTGSMILGFRDRFGDQTGVNERFRQSDASNTWGVAAGDILRVCQTGSGFVTEGATGCTTSGGLTNSGPGGATAPEHYNWDLWHFNDYNTENTGGGYHWETTQGGLSQVAGKPTILTTDMDPSSDYSGGYLRLDNATGRREGLAADGSVAIATAQATGGYTLFETGDFTSTQPTSNTYFGKANGLGDIEALTNPAPIEIGNRVWRDANGNGRQDPNEAAIADVLVGLYNASGTLVSTVETNAAGQYLFSSSTTGTDVNADGDATPEYDYGLAIAPETNYTVAVLSSNFSTGGALFSQRATTANSATSGGLTTNDAVADVRDSDGVTLGAAVGSGANSANLGVGFTTGTTGSNNHSFDFGFAEGVAVGSTVFNDANNNGVQDAGETGIGGVAVELLYDADGSGTITGTELTTPYATTTTSTGSGANLGNYLFSGLPAGNYQVRIPTPPTGLELSSTTTDTADNREDNDDNGTQTLTAGGATVSPVINLAVDAEPTNAVETGQGGGQDDGAVADNDGDMTVDFGFTTPTYSIGNRVWFDTNNDGQINSGEVGINGVSVSIYASGSPGTILGTQNTNSLGYYRFDNLAAGTYVVRINSTNFANGAVLAGYQNTTGNTAGDLDSTATAGQNGEDGINPTGNANTVQSNGILSNPITLGAFAEPTGEADVQTAGQGTVDNLANMTVDFGFYRMNLSGTVWRDNGAGGTAANFNNGLLDGTEPGIANIQVQIYSGATEILVGADGILGTSDDAAGGMLTNGSGGYNFQGLPPGTYRVVTTPPAGAISSTPTVADPNGNVDNDDNGFPNSTEGFTNKIISGTITLTPAGEVSFDNATGRTLNPTVDFGYLTVGPTAVRLDKFDAYTDGDSTELRWTTGEESGNLGFNVYREANGKRQRLNAAPIAGNALRFDASLQASGGEYSWTDKSSAPNAVYYLEDLDVNGGETLHGAVTPQFRQSLGDQPNARMFSDLATAESSDGTREIFAVENNRVSKTKDAAALAIVKQQQIAALGGAKIIVKRDGWYRVSAQQLRAAGFDVKSNSQNWQLYADGAEVPFKLNSDSIEFFGRAVDTPLTDKQVYYLINGQSEGLRISQIEGGEAQPQADARSFAVTVERRDRTTYVSSLRNGEDQENWFGAVVNRNSQTIQNLNAVNVDPHGQARLSLKLQGIVAVPHSVSVKFNNVELGAVEFDGFENKQFVFDLPAAAVVEGANRVYLQSNNANNDVSLVDSIRLGYLRGYTAQDNRIRFKVPANQSVRVNGFSDENISVYEIRNGAAQQQIVGASENSEGVYGFSLSAATVEREMIAVVNATVEQASVEPNAPSTLHSEENQADFVIITSGELRASADTLAAMREAQGLRTKVVLVEDIFDEFSFGRRDPAAVKTFLNRAASGWKTRARYALLFGDSSYDPRNNLGLNVTRDHVPTKLVDTANMETASDAWLADFDNDGAEDIALGRLPVGDATEAAAAIEKLARFDNQTRTEKLSVLVADTNFENYSQELQALLPRDVNSFRVDRSQGTDAETHQQIVAQLNNNPLLVTYTGHGSQSVWASSGIFNQTDAAALANNGLSFYLLMNCLNGYTPLPTGDSLAETLFKSPNAAVAVWTSSGITNPESQAAISKAFTNFAFNARTGKSFRVGDIARAAKQASDDADVRRTWLLVGDPTIFVK